MSKAQNARPKRARIETEKIKPFRAEVKKQKAQRKSRKRSKAQREDYSLDPQSQESVESEGEGQESDLPDANEVGRSTRGQETRREVLVRKLQAHGDFDVSEMDNTELETVWANVKRSKDANKRKLFGKTSKVVDNAPARPAISPNKKRGRSPSPKPILNKRSRSEVDTHKQSKSMSKEQSTRSRGESQPKKPKKSSNPHSSVSRASSRSSSRAPSTLAGFRVASSARSSNVRGPANVDSDDDEDKDGSEDEDGDEDDDENKGKGDSEGEGEDVSDDDSESNASEESSSGLASSVRYRPLPGKGPKEKVKSGDFTGTERVILDETVHLVECHLLLVNYFLSPRDLFVVTKEMWEAAVRNQKEKIKNFPIHDRVFKAVKERINSFRGRLRGIVLGAGEGLLNAYGLKGCSQGSTEAIEVVDAILPHGVHVKPGSEPGYGYFQHEFILEAIYKIVFTGRHPLGRKYPDKFRTFPPRLVTLTSSLIHGVLDKYKLAPHSGNMGKDEHLSLADVLSYYKIHRKTMKLFVDNQRKRCFKIVLPLLSKLCFEHAGMNQSAPAVKPREYEALTANNFAQDEPTEEEMALLGLPVKSKATTGGSSRTHSPLPTSLNPEPELLLSSRGVTVEEACNSAASPPPTSPATNTAPQRPQPKPRPKPPTDDSEVHGRHDLPTKQPTVTNIPATPTPSTAGSGSNGERTLSLEEPRSGTSALATTRTAELVSGAKFSPRQIGLVVELSTKPVRKGPATAKKLRIINKTSTSAKAAD